MTQFARQKKLISMGIEERAAVLASLKNDIDSNDIKNNKNSRSKPPVDTKSVIPQPQKITRHTKIDTKLPDWIWYRNNNKDNAYVRVFAVLSDNTIKLYKGRNAFKANENPIHTIKLLTTTEIVDGNDIVVLDGFLSKKGKMKWNNRWCVLRRDGYIQYLDHRDHVKRIDFSTAHLKLQDKMIQWKHNNGELVQFYFDDQSVKKKWHYKMLQIQNKYETVRAKYNNKFMQLKTLFSFTLLQTTKMENKSINIKEHYFYLADDKRLKECKKCVHDSVAEITVNILKKKYESNDERTSNIQFKKAIKKIQTVANRRNSLTKQSKHTRKPSIIDSMNDQIGKYAMQKVNKHKVEKVMKKLQEQLESNKYDSIDAMSKSIKKIHEWFFGDVLGGEHYANTDLVIEYITDKSNLFFKMFQCINYLDFNARKQMTQIIAEIIKHFDMRHNQQYIVSVTNDYGHNVLVQCLFDKYDVNSNEILIEMVYHSELVSFLLNKVKIQSRNKKKHYRFVDILLKFMGNNDVVVSLCAYKTLHCLLVTKDKTSRVCITNYLDHKFEGIFHKLNEMMRYENCLVQKYALKLLFDIFSFESNYPTMMKYICNKQYFVCCVNLIKKYHNNSVSFAAWNIFKYFIYNYNKIQQKEIKSVIFEHKKYMIELIETLSSDRASDKNFAKEREMIVNKLSKVFI